MSVFINKNGYASKSKAAKSKIHNRIVYLVRICIFYVRTLVRSLLRSIQHQLICSEDEGRKRISLCCTCLQWEKLRKVYMYDFDRCIQLIYSIPLHPSSISIFCHCFSFRSLRCEKCTEQRACSRHIYVLTFSEGGIAGKRKEKHTFFSSSD